MMNYAVLVSADESHQPTQGCGVRAKLGNGKCLIQHFKGLMQPRFQNFKYFF